MAKRCSSSARAALLLEVVVSVAIMTASLAVLGAQLSAGIKMARQADDLTRAGMMADYLIGLLEINLEEQQTLLQTGETEGDFLPQFPGYYYRLEVEEVEAEEEVVSTTTAEGETTTTETPARLFAVTIEIYYDATKDERGSIDSARWVSAAHMLRAEPPQVDLERDFGVSAEAIEMLRQFLPDFDPNNFNPQELISMLSDLAAGDPQQVSGVMLTLLPALRQFSGSSGDVQNLMSQAAGGADAAQILQQITTLLQQNQGALGGAGGALRGNRDISGGGEDDGGGAPPDDGGGMSQEEEIRQTILRLMEERQGGGSR